MVGILGGLNRMGGYCTNKTIHEGPGTYYLPTYLQCSSTTLGKAVKENAEKFRYVCTIKMNKSTNLVLIIFGFSVFSNV